MAAKATAQPRDATQLRPEDLSPIERKLGDPTATRAEREAALDALFDRAEATPGGIYMVPEGLEDDDGAW
jgi:hypothetical protein